MAEPEEPAGGEGSARFATHDVGRHPMQDRVGRLLRIWMGLGCDTSGEPAAHPSHCCTRNPRVERVHWVASIQTSFRRSP